MFVKNFYYYYTKLFSDQFCDYVIRKGKELVEQDGKVGSSGKGKKDNKIRDSKITWIKDRDILEPGAPFPPPGAGGNGAPGSGSNIQACLPGMSGGGAGGGDAQQSNPKGNPGGDGGGAAGQRADGS